ncbi:conserved hypothetical protein [Catenulispora acidiphila DSM 44928]|uniref:Uncharacterized protein n=1 Tax=Catenulispora acidiphila (strain DSM 44928 / JCM 14897 / NBRC 102108 / NRRL B-24433 / ID139908) TaxID=479433 RepID=C7PWQ3_CATAD|nr:DUF6081 family protein [Catenulispora acidiphila]ACU75333.1 conserved hypothetical protein [Catenulispora acidiphila DSM 44928]
MSQHDPTGLEAARTASPVFHDDFHKGFAAAGPGALWQVRPAAGLPAGDGAVLVSPLGLHVAPPHTDPATGEPRFADAGDQPVHVRWAALAARTSKADFPGFDAVPGTWLVLETQMSVTPFGLERIGAAADDPAVAAAALITTDRETGMVFDFMVTGGRVFAVYERLGAPDAPHAAFTYTVPVAVTQPGRSHTCVVAYDASAGTVRWILNGSNVLTVDRIGERMPDDSALTRDNGRPAAVCTPRQLAVGLGMFAEKSLGQGVRLVVRRVTVRRG